MTSIAIASLMFARAMAPQLDVPALLQDRSIFTYLKPGNVMVHPQGEYYAFDALPEAALKPNAPKLRVVLVVAERHFPSPDLSNIIERRDKDRLVALLPIVANYLKNYAQGEVEVSIVSKFIPEPIFRGETMNIARIEFNRDKFDADDSVDRGPYDLSVAIESSAIARYVGEPKIGAGWLSAHIVGATMNRLTADGATGLFEMVPGGVIRLSKPIVDYFQGKGSLADINRQTNGTPSTAPVGVVYPIVLSKEGDALEYIEECLVRNERLPLPFNEGNSTAKSLSFEYKSFTQNPLAVRLRTASGWEEAVLPSGVSDWKSFQVRSKNGEVIQDAQIGVPRLLQGKTRSYSDLTRFQFKNFVMNATAEGTATEPDAGSRPQEVVFEEMLSGETFDALKARLTSLNTAEAVMSLRQMMSRASRGSASPEEMTFLNTVLTGPYSESVRAESLAWVGKVPGLGSFPQVAPNAVRENWQVRRAAIFALAELAKAGVKEKEGCRQLILMSTAQEMALIRLAAYESLDFSIEDSRKRAEYALINDPSESVRIFLARKLCNTAEATYDSVKGVLADESVNVRATVAGAPEVNALLRRLKQSLVVDASPRVRAAALQGLAYAKDVQPGEIQNTFADTDPLIQLQLVNGATNGAWKLPAEVIARLKESPFKAIASGAANLK